MIAKWQIKDGGIRQPLQSNATRWLHQHYSPYRDTSPQHPKVGKTATHCAVMLPGRRPHQRPKGGGGFNLSSQYLLA
jgi:hypothetical protein